MVTLHWLHFQQILEIALYIFTIYPLSYNNNISFYKREITGFKCTCINMNKKKEAKKKENRRKRTVKNKKNGFRFYLV